MSGVFVKIFPETPTVVSVHHVFTAVAPFVLKLQNPLEVHKALTLVCKRILYISAIGAWAALKAKIAVPGVVVPSVRACVSTVAGVPEHVHVTVIAPMSAVVCNVVIGPHL